VRALLVLLALLIAGCSAAPPPPPPRTCDAPPLQGLPASGPEEVRFSTPDEVLLEGSLWTGSLQHGVVLIHGLNEERSRWQGPVEELTARGFTVLTFDLRGHGGSRQRAGMPYELRNFTPEDFRAMDRDAAAAVEVLRGRGVGPCIAVGGASIGANLALRVAAAKPDVVSTALLLSPGADYRGVTTAQAAQQYQGEAAFLAAGRGDAYAAQGAEELGRALGPRATVVLLDTNAHGTNLLGQPGFQERLVAWIQAAA
jgi:alpha-beta hydrolase superfamily lysophospholipase